MGIDLKVIAHKVIVPGNRPQGNRPQGNRPQGDRPYKKPYEKRF